MADLKKKNSSQIRQHDICNSHAADPYLTILNNNLSGIKSLVKIIFSHRAAEFCHVYIINPAD